MVSAELQTQLSAAEAKLLYAEQGAAMNEAIQTKLAHIEAALAQAEIRADEKARESEGVRFQLQALKAQLGTTEAKLSQATASKEEAVSSAEEVRERAVGLGSHT